MTSNKEIIESFLNNNLSYDLNYYLNDPQYIEVMERYLGQENRRLKKRVKNILLGYLDYQESNEIKQLELLLDELVIQVEQLKLENERLKQQKLVENERLKQQELVEDEKYTALITWIIAVIICILLKVMGFN